MIAIIPLIPLIGTGMTIGGAVLLKWYDSLSSEEKNEANLYVCRKLNIKSNEDIQLQIEKKPQQDKQQVIQEVQNQVKPLQK